MARSPERPRRSRAFVAALAAAVVGMGVLAWEPTASASVAVNEVYAIPSTGTYAGTFTILGRGYGHGHGMSQYGAKGAANQGLGYGSILSFYYPGTTRTKASGYIRVRLSGPATDSLQVLPSATLAVLDTGNGTKTSLPTSVAGGAVSQWRLGVNGQGKALVSYYRSGWKAYKTLVGDGQFVDSSRGYVTLASPSAKRYRGGLLAASSGGHRYAVNVVTLDSYVAGVVPSEMPTDWPAAALQSQAVAARTYALSERADHVNSYYDLCDTTWCQVYGGMDAEVASSNQAVKATSGVYLSYGGKPAFTQFSASNGGWESDGGKPYLPSKADPYTPSAEEVYGRDYSWSLKNTSVAPLQNYYPSIGTLRSVVITSREGGRGATWNGRVVSMTLQGTSGSRVISGNTFAAIFGLGSTWFTLQVASTASKPVYAVGQHVSPAWKSALGKPTSAEIATTWRGVRGYYQRFENHSIIASSKYGTFAVSGAILKRWSSVRDGWPRVAMTRQTAFAVLGWTQKFQADALLSSKYGTYTSNGSILASWRAAQRGWPTADLKSTTYRKQAGWIQTFERGSSGSDFAFAPRSTGTPTWYSGAPS